MNYINELYAARSRSYISYSELQKGKLHWKKQTNLKSVEQINQVCILFVFYYFYLNTIEEILDRNIFLGIFTVLLHQSVL